MFCKLHALHRWRCSNPLPFWTLIRPHRPYRRVMYPSSAVRRINIKHFLSTFSMDSSLTAFISPSQLQNPNAELHSITSQQPSKWQCILRRKAFKRPGKLLSKVERDFRSLLSFSPTTESNPKLEVQRRCWTETQEFLCNAIFDVEGGEGERESFEFFRGLFEKEETLREIYVNDSAICMLLCLVCGGNEKRKIRVSSRGIVMHACAVGKTKKVGMHRAFGRVVCEVLGWDVNEYLSICESKVGDKSMKLKKMVSPIRYRYNVLHSEVPTLCYNPRSPFQQVMMVNRFCSEMDLDKNDFQVAADNRDKSKGDDEIVEKIQQLNFNATFSATECNTLQYSTSLNGTNNCSKDLKSTINSFSQMMSTGRTGTTSHFGTLGPTVGECIERLKSLHGLCVGSELFNFACNLMGSNENREIFMELGDDMARYAWLEFNYDKDGQFKP